MAKPIPINVGEDYITCPKCRTVIGIGRQCRCSMRTHGPRAEPVLTRIVTGRNRVTHRRR